MEFLFKNVNSQFPSSTSQPEFTLARTETLLRALLCGFKMARRSIVQIGSAVYIEFCFRIEASTTDHLRDCAPNLEKSKAMQNSPAQKDRNQEDWKFFDNFAP